MVSTEGRPSSGAGCCPGVLGATGWLWEEEPSGVRGAQLGKNQWQHWSRALWHLEGKTQGLGQGGRADPGPSSDLVDLSGQGSEGSQAPGRGARLSWPKLEVGGLTPGHLGPLP